MKPLRIGVVGSGTWADRVHLPAIAEHPELALSGVWSRNTDAAERLAMRHDSFAALSYDALLNASDIIAFAVPPVAQPVLAAQAARAGRHVILEKPIAEHAFEADFLARIVQESGIGAVVCLLRLFDRAHVAWLDEMRQRSCDRMEVRWLSDAMLDGSPFATDWRRASGALVDIAPHIICQAEHVFGPVDEASLQRDGSSIRLHVTHASSQVTEATIDLEHDGEALEEYSFAGAGVSSIRAVNLDLKSAYTELLDQMVLRAQGVPQSGPAWELKDAARAVDIVETLALDGHWDSASTFTTTHEQART